MSLREAIKKKHHKKRGRGSGKAEFFIGVKYGHLSVIEVGDFTVLAQNIFFGKKKGFEIPFSLF